jgi:hypothetical protein
MSGRKIGEIRSSSRERGDIRNTVDIIPDWSDIICSTADISELRERQSAIIF